MNVPWIYYPVAVITTGSIVLCDLKAGTWQTMAQSCQLANATSICDEGSPDICKPKTNITNKDGQYWIGAYVKATTIIRYAGCRELPENNRPTINSTNITLADCIQKCNSKFEEDKRINAFGLYKTSCFCTTGNIEKTLEGDCNLACEENDLEPCGGEKDEKVYISTFRFDKVPGTSKSGVLSFEPVCGFQNGSSSELEFDNCMKSNKAACEDSSESDFEMNWPMARKWCQNQSSKLIGQGKLTTEIRAWINLVKHQFVQWTDGNVPESTHCLSVSCTTGKCSFSSLKCTSNLNGLCWTKSEEDANVPVTNEISITPTSSTNSAADITMTTPSRQENFTSSVQMHDAHSSNKPLVYIAIAIPVICVSIIVIIVVFVVCRRRKASKKNGQVERKSLSSMEETGKPLVDQNLEPTEQDTIHNDDYDTAYARVTSFAPSENEPELEGDGYDLLRPEKQREGKVDSAYDHIPIAPTDDTYHVLQSADDSKQENIGDFMYDVTSAIDGLRDYDTFTKSKPDDISGNYDTTESVLRSQV